MSTPTPSTTTTTRSPEQAATALFNDVRSTSAAIERGDWLAAGIGVTNVAMDVISLGGDPLGSISSAGFGWLLQHVSFLREPFDALLGDANAIINSAQSWSKSCLELAGTADRYRRETAQQTRNWRGAAADSYRRASETQARNLESLSKVAKGVGEALAGAGKALAEIRKAVIDTINQACNKIIMIIIEALAAAWGSFGASIAKGIAQSVQTAVSAAQKMLTKIQKLIQTLQKIMQLVQKVLQLAQAVKQLLEKIGGIANPGGGNNTVRPMNTQPVNYAGNISGRDGITPNNPGGVTLTSGTGYTLESPSRMAWDAPGTMPSLDQRPAMALEPPRGMTWGPSGPPPNAGSPASRQEQARWIGSAVQILVEHGVDPSRIDTGRIAEIVNTNSGGNPHAVNFNDPSAQNGYPPKGLMQITDPVFQQHQMPGYANIWRPVDNLLAGIMYYLMMMQFSQGQPGISRPVH
jgi:hypothetical protein